MSNQLLNLIDRDYQNYHLKLLKLASVFKFLDLRATLIKSYAQEQDLAAFVKEVASSLEEALLEEKFGAGEVVD